MINYDPSLLAPFFDFHVVSLPMTGTPIRMLKANPNRIGVIIQSPSGAATSVFVGGNNAANIFLSFPMNAQPFKMTFWEFGGFVCNEFWASGAFVTMIMTEIVYRPIPAGE